jgi:peptidoglycan/LPS O-acetylase OafA/YrhL
MTRRRLVTVSVVQFFASVCIMLRHYSYFIKTEFPDLALAMSYVTFSDFFFCCSGFLLHYVNANKESVELGPMLRKRFFKLYPLHLLTTLFYVSILILSAYVGSIGNTRSSWDCVLPTLTLTHAFGTVDRQCLNYPSWFLSALFAMYLVYLPVRMLIAKVGPGWIIAFILLLVTLYEAAYRLGGLPQWTTLTFNFGVLRGIPTFLSGVVIAEMLPTIASRVKSFRPAYAVFILSVAGMMAGIDPLLSQIMLPVALVALLAGAEAYGAESFLRLPKVAQVGAWSFPLYLLHVPVAAVLMNLVIVRILHIEGPMLVPATLVTAAVAIGAAFAAHTVMDVWVPRWRKTLRPSMP